MISVHECRRRLSLARDAVLRVLRRIAIIAAYLAPTLLIVFLLHKIVPYEGDEFSQYHPILCRYYPLNALNTFTDGCDVYALHVLGTSLVLPLRSFYYVGSFPSLIYLPLFLLWKSPMSARWLGLLFLTAESWILGRLFRIKQRDIFAGLLLFFPYMFAHAVDTGPVAFQLLSLFLLAFLFRRWTRTLQSRYPLLVALVLFCGVWTKLVYILLLPGIAALFVLSVYEEWGRMIEDHTMKKFWTQALWCGALFTALTAVLLCSTGVLEQGNGMYGQELLRGGDAWSLQDLESRFDRIYAVQVLVNPYGAAHRIFQVWNVPVITGIYDALTFFALPLLIILGFFLIPSEWKRLNRAAIFYAVFGCTLLLIVRVKISWAIHHVILAFPFLILSALAFFEALVLTDETRRATALRRITQLVVLCLLIVNVIVTVSFAFEPTQSNNDRSKLAVEQVLADPMLAQRYLYVATHWSVYFSQALYGDRRQGVLYLHPLNSSDQIQALKELAASQRRKLLFLVNEREQDADLSLLRRSFLLKPCGALSGSGAWQVLLQPDAETNPCNSATVAR